jgi:hypothetical protein
MAGLPMFLLLLMMMMMMMMILLLFTDFAYVLSTLYVLWCRKPDPNVLTELRSRHPRIPHSHGRNRRDYLAFSVYG